MNSEIGIVVIGRNEGERLRRCLSSLATRLSVVYVDSGSTDDSMALARATGADVVLLDSSMPFTAARARNVGFARLIEILPDVDFVQFIDGDCEIAEGWVKYAYDYLSTNPDVVLVCGHLREQHPEASLYNRLGDDEWRRPTGDITSCGGIFMIRRASFDQVGGFDATIAAGEEPDLCCRIRAAGMRIVRLDHAMAAHDLNMFRFSQWWRRSVRGGYGALKLTLFGPAVSRHVFRRQVMSVLSWGVVLPCAVLVSTTVASINGFSVWTMVIPVLGLILLGLQALRIAIMKMRGGAPMHDAAAVGAFTILWKFAAVVGFVRCMLDWLRDSRHPDKVAPVRVFHKSQ